jgi:glycerol dehydrogenase
MIQRTVFPGRYTQGEGAIHELGTELKRLGTRGFAICTSQAFQHVLPQVEAEVNKCIAFAAEHFGGECSREEIRRLTDKARAFACDIIIGIGGGKSLDAAKVVAYNLGVPVAMVPTIASTDAPCSAVAIIYSPDGVFDQVMLLPRNPALVLVDTAIIAHAPVRFLIAGMGDALATWFEAESCQISQANNVAGGKGSMTAYALARLCYTTLLENGPAAVEACSKKTITPELEKIIEANTLLSGIGFESGGLATAHSIHNGFTVLAGAHATYHGEKVAFGTLASLFLMEKPQETINEVYSFCKATGLPTKLSDLRLYNLTDDELRKVAEKTCANGESVYNEPRQITPHQVLMAIKAADIYGEKFSEALGLPRFPGQRI